MFKPQMKLFKPGGDGNHAADVKSALIASQLMQSPEALAASQDKLGGMVGINSGYIQR